jgi:hypothetical protein
MCLWFLFNLVLAVNDISRPIVAAHDAHVTVLPGQLERVGDLVHVRLEERQNGAESTGSVSSLIVVIVDEYQSIKSIQLIPGLAVVLEVGKLLSVVLAYDVTKVLAMAEFCDSTDISVFVVADCLATQVNYLQSGNISLLNRRRFLRKLCSIASFVNHDVTLTIEQSCHNELFCNLLQFRLL